MLKNIKNHFKSIYYTYQPGEFLPVYSGGELLNKKEFHKYRIRKIINNRAAFMYQLTHTTGEAGYFYS